MSTIIRESTASSVVAAAPGRIKVGLITPGLGSSGYYSQQVLENAARDKVWPKGTHIFFDHPSEAEMYDRPERSVRDLAGILDEDAYWDGTGLVAEAKVIGPYRDLVTDPVFIESVGMSIRAAGEARVGEVDGQKCQIITQLSEGMSVDLVTRAGRGGRVMAVLESARAAARKVQEASANDTREALQAALREAYPGEQVWVWVRDFDDEAGTVWYEHETPDSAGTYAEGFTIDDAGAVTLAGDRVEVRARTEYVPVDSTTSVTGTATEAEQQAALEVAAARLAEAGHISIEHAREVCTEAMTRFNLSPNVPAPAGRNTPTPYVQEDTTMGHIQVDEAEHGRLTEAAGRVPTLESERDTANQRAEAAERKLRDRDNTDAATRVIDTQAREAGVTFSALERRGLLAGMPLAESGDLDEAAFTEAVTTAAAEKAAANGAGSIRGFGDTADTGSTQVGESDANKAVAGAFGRTITEG